MQLATTQPPKIFPENDIDLLIRSWTEIDYKDFSQSYENFLYLNKKYPGIFDINIELIEKKLKKKKKKKLFLGCPKISVIVPVYNNAEYLEECLNSIIHQTISELEIIIINDGSTDKKTFEILHKYAEIDKRIVLINKKK